MARNVKIPEPIAAVLKEYNVTDYEIEPCKKHSYLKVNGKRVCTLSHGGKRAKHHTEMNSALRVKRAIIGRTGR